MFSRSEQNGFARRFAGQTAQGPPERRRPCPLAGPVRARAWHGRNAGWLMGVLVLPLLSAGARGQVGEGGTGQKAASPAPAIEFVKGDPVSAYELHIVSPYGDPSTVSPVNLDAMKWLGRLAVRFPASKDALWELSGGIIEKDALEATYGRVDLPSGDPAVRYWQTPEVPDTRGRAHVQRGRAWESADGAVAEWQILAEDEATVRKLALAFIQSLHSYLTGRLQEHRDTREADLKEIEELRSRCEELREQVSGLREEICTANAEGMSPAAIDAAVTRIDLEQRLNHIDIVGIRAGIEAAKARREAMGREGMTHADLDAPPLLQRIEIELEVQLAGRLARGAALQQELDRLRAAHRAAQKLAEAERDLGKLQGEIQAYEQRVASNPDWIRFYERLGNFQVVDSRVTLCPIAPARP